MSERLEMIEALGTEHPCVYLPNQLARLVYLFPRSPLTPLQIDEQLSRGQRRSGLYLYYVHCRQCRACQPTRVLVDQFVWSKSLRRVETRGDKVIHCEFRAAMVDEQHVQLYNSHRGGRNLGDPTEVATPSEYREFLINTCCETRELCYFVDDEMVGCTIVDCGKDSLSAVYTYFNPSFEHLSIGTFAVLKLLRMAQQWKMQYVYLGLYVANNQHLRYKARYIAQERLIDGRWIKFIERTDTSL